ncbi:hypothetical protein EG327_001355 [Venturia inaequalis]|uniref:Uncharacterized protein n=1 Tax=Venturia inaequalis TaxID=5025 RepID=A0A8H3VP65_VENIN|nr:hypothetical protein EG327_001355 [Venturia inaequalis]
MGLASLTIEQSDYEQSSHNPDRYRQISGDAQFRNRHKIVHINRPLKVLVALSR